MSVFSSNKPPQIESGITKLPWGRLFLNHADAWVTTLAIVSVALLIHGRLNRQTAPLAIAIGVGYWMAFAINDYFDVPVDRLDPEKRERNFFAAVSIPLGWLWIAFLLLSMAILPIFLSYGWRSLAVLGLSFTVMWGYSAPPLRVKDRPGWDILIHATFVETFPYAATLFLIDATWSGLDIALLWLAVLTSIGAQLENQIRDAAHDAQFGETFTTRIGPERALWTLRAVTALDLVYGVTLIGFGLIPRLVVPLGLLIIPALATRFWRTPNQPRPERLIRILVGLGALYLGWLGFITLL